MTEEERAKIRNYSNKAGSMNWVGDRFLPFSEAFENELINLIEYTLGNEGITAKKIKYKMMQIEYESTF